MKIGKLNIIIAICASCAMIAFAFYQRSPGSATLPAAAFYIAATVICLLPVAQALLRCKLRRR